MTEGLHPATEGFHPFQLLFLNEQTALSSSELQPHPVQSHSCVTMATVSNRVHMGAQRKTERARERERKTKDREEEKFLVSWKSEPGITRAELLTEKVQPPLRCPAAPPRSHGDRFPRFSGRLLALPLANSQTVIINTDDATLPSVLGGCEI